jgi:uncharacterized membrane protein YheB (UPF0754 family)
MEGLPQALSHIQHYTDSALNVKNLLREKMSNLPPSEFEGLLHPVFQEDEWKLVLMGGGLGVIIGITQIYITGGT